MSANQKQEEKLVMHYFRDNYNEFPRGKLVNSESPDFILKINPKKSFGIELTRLPNSGDLVEALSEIIEKKEQKIYLYQGQGFVQIWLLIYADDLMKSIKYNIQNKLAKLVFPTSFDKILLFDLFEKRIFQLNS